MSWIRIWTHIVFSTKNHEPFLTSEIRKELFGHIQENAKAKNLKLEIINGYTDHVHCLLCLNKDLSLSKSVQLIKGESSHWFNKSGFLKSKFSWQDDYWAVGVSESHFNAVKTYIANQENHHKTESFANEIDAFMAKYGWQFSGKN